MVKMIKSGIANPTDKVMNLMSMNDRAKGDYYLDLKTGDIVSIAEGEEKAEPVKKREKK